jgi:ubiquinone/menaquinone biosynthesis C-methylase UbiE
MTDEPATASIDADLADPSGWTGEAERYDRWFNEPWGAYAFAVERDALIDAAGDIDHRVVADVGCGTGRLTTHLEALGATVLALDTDHAMLTVAARRTHASLLRADGQRLPVRSASVDVAIATTVCEFATDPPTLIAELARITRPGGRVVVGALNRHSPWGLANRHRFHEPRWDTARFLSPAELHHLGTPHGPVTIRHQLYPPAALPLLATWGPIAELIGRTIAPHWGAFTVMTIEQER